MSSDSDRDPVEALAEEFLERKRLGENPTLEEYCARHPELAEDIRDLFPALLLIEHAKPLSHEDSEEPTPDLRGVGLQENVGEYRILREIGRGGMGIVYEAEHQQLGRRVALKILSQPLVRDGKSLERFRREARAAARLHHTNIVPVFEVGQAGDLAYYAMQYIQGHGLDQIIKELQQQRSGDRPPGKNHAAGEVALARSLWSGQFQPKDFHEPSPESPATVRVDMSAMDPSPISSSIMLHGRLDSPESVSARGTRASRSDRWHYYRSTAQIGQQVASALAYAHAHGIVHRDIKPSNLLLDLAGVVWVTDFGLAKTDDDDLTRSGDVLGTIRYMAPERFRKECDPRADIYALGMTLYELLALKPAFQATDRLKLIDVVCHTEPAPLRSLDRHMPRDLETIILKATDKNPKTRYVSAEEMAEDLRRFLDDEPIQARRLTLAERFARWVRRHPGVAALSAVIALLLLSVALVSGISAARFRRDAEENARLAEQKEQQRRKAVAARRDAEQQRQEAVVARQQSEQRSAGGFLRTGIDLSRRGFPAEGLASMLLGLEAAQAGQAPHLEQVIRVNLQAWQTHLIPERARFRHERWIWDVAFSPDGTRVATASKDTFIKIWDRRTGKLLGRPLKHRYPVWSLCFTPDSQTLISGSGAQKGKGGEINFWEVRTGKRIGDPLVLEASLNKILLSPDGQVLLSYHPQGRIGPYSAGDVQLWDVKSRRPIGSLFQPRRRTVSMAFTPDGSKVLTGGADGLVRAWSSRTAREVGVFQVPGLPPTTKEQFHAIVQVLPLPDGEGLLTGHFVIKQGQPAPVNRALLWNPDTGKPLALAMSLPGLCKELALSPDGQRIAAGVILPTPGEDGKPMGAALLFDAQGKPIHGLLIHPKPVWSVAFSPDSRLLATGCEDALLRFWEVNTGQRIHSGVPHNGTIRAVVFSPDGSQVATAPAGGYPESVLCDVPYQAVERLPPPPEHLGAVLALSEDGRRAALVQENGTVHLWDWQEGKPVGFPLPHPTPVLCAAFDARGERLFTSSAEGLWVWNVQTGKPVGPIHNPDLVAFALVPSQVGRTLLAVSRANRFLSVWRVDGEVVKECEPSLRLPQTRVATISDDGRLIASSSMRDPLVRLWDTATGKPRPVTLRVPDRMSVLAFSPDGQQLVTGCINGFARVWDVPTGNPVGRALLHSTAVSRVRISPEGDVVAIGCVDGNIYLYDMSTGLPLGPALGQPGPIRHLLFLGDGRLLRVGARNRARIWTLSRPREGSVAELRAWLRLEEEHGKVPR
jgi:WD40 repeat protein/serine/threonine protein kinase